MSGLIAVCLRPVWRTDVALRLAPAGKAPLRDGGHSVADPAGMAALHCALTLRQAGAVERVEAWCVGPLEAAEVLREALACGADAAHHLGGRLWPADSAALGDGSAGSTAQAVQALAPALRHAAPRLVLCGERSDDSAHEAFGALLAQALDAAFAHRATAVSAAGEGWQVRVKLERGYTQEMPVPSPAVVAVAAQAPRPAYPALPAWLAARQADIPCQELAPARPTGNAVPASTLRVPVPRVKAQPSLPAGLDAEARIRAMVTVETGSGGEVLGPELGAARQAEAVLELLRERGYLEA